MLVKPLQRLHGHPNYNLIDVPTHGNICFYPVNVNTTLRVIYERQGLPLHITALQHFYGIKSRITIIIKVNSEIIGADDYNQSEILTLHFSPVPEHLSIN